MDLPYQVAMLYALIQCFGPNQVVGITALEDPLENLSFERSFFSETFNSYLSLPYILQPEISLPPWHTLPQVISSEAGIATGGLYSNVTSLTHSTQRKGHMIQQILVQWGPFLSKAYSRPSRSAGGQAGNQDNQSQQEDNQTEQE